MSVDNAERFARLSDESFSTIDSRGKRATGRGGKLGELWRRRKDGDELLTWYVRDR